MAARRVETRSGLQLRQQPSPQSDAGTYLRRGLCEGRFPDAGIDLTFDRRVGSVRKRVAATSISLIAAANSPQGRKWPLIQPSM